MLVLLHVLYLRGIVWFMTTSQRCVRNHTFTGDWLAVRAETSVDSAASPILSYSFPHSSSHSRLRRVRKRWSYAVLPTNAIDPWKDTSGKGISTYLFNWLLGKRVLASLPGTGCYGQTTPRRFCSPSITFRRLSQNYSSYAVRRDRSDLGMCFQMLELYV